MICVLRGSFDVIHSSQLPLWLVSWVLSVLVSSSIVALMLSLQLANSNGLLVCLASLLMSCNSSQDRHVDSQTGVVATTGLALIIICLFCLTLWLPPLFELACRAYAGRPLQACPTAAKRRAREKTGVALAIVALAVVFVLATLLPWSPVNFEPASMRAFVVGDAFTTPKADLYTFYAYVFVVAAVGVVASRPGPLRGFFQLHGQKLFWVSLICMLAYLSWYWWVTRYNGFVVETLARVSGQLSNVLLGLLLFPVSRNSVIATLMGLSYDHSLVFHSVFGWAFFATVLAHALLSYAAFDPSFRSWYPRSGAGTDWTTALVTVIAAIVLLGMGLTSTLAFRKRRWDTFKTMHYLSLVLFIAVLWHAPGAWAYTVGGLAIYLVDRGLRFSKAVLHRRAEFSLVDDVIVITYASSQAGACHRPKTRVKGSDEESFVVATLYIVPSPASKKTEAPLNSRKPTCAFMRKSRAKSTTKTYQLDGDDQPRFFDAGQYAWIRVRGEHLLEPALQSWHPISYSSSPYDAKTTHHIKVCAEDQWSGKLAAAILAGSDVDLFVDGPYGCSPPLGRRRYLFVAGGIGITPCASLLRTLMLADMLLKCDQACLLWVAKHRYMFNLFADSLNLPDLTQAEPSSRFFARLYESSYFAASKVADESGSSLLVNHGRPDIDMAVKALLHGLDDPSEALVYVCGPPSLANATRKAAAAGRTNFYAASFVL